MSEDKTTVFDGQREDETVEVSIAKHPIILLVPGLKTVVLAALSVAIALFWASDIATPIFIAILVLAMLLFFRHYLNYSRSSLIVTNQRVLIIEPSGVWGKEVSEAELANIQDSSSQSKGFLRSILHYGDLIIRTAGADKETEIVVRDIPNPYEIQQLISNSAHSNR